MAGTVPADTVLLASGSLSSLAQTEEFVAPSGMARSVPLRSSRGTTLRPVDVEAPVGKTRQGSVRGVVRNARQSVGGAVRPAASGSEQSGKTSQTKGQFKLTPEAQGPSGMGPRRGWSGVRREGLCRLHKLEGEGYHPTLIRVADTLWHS